VCEAACDVCKERQVVMRARQVVVCTKARCTFEEAALGDEGEVGEPGVQAVKDVGGVHNGGPPHLTLLPATNPLTSMYISFCNFVLG